MEKVPEGGALMVSNHSGGLIAMDVPVLAVAFPEEFGPDRPLYVLAHDLLFLGAADPSCARRGSCPPPARTPHAVLASGGVTIVFPGGDYDVFRPSSGAQQDRLRRPHGLRPHRPARPACRSSRWSASAARRTRSTSSAASCSPRLLGLEKRLRTKYLPVTFGFPFGLTLAFPPNLPLPTKIRTRVLEPIDIVEEFGADPDIAEVDRVVRERMQAAIERAEARAALPGARMSRLRALCVALRGCCGPCGSLVRSGHDRADAAGQVPPPGGGRSAARARTR